MPDVEEPVGLGREAGMDLLHAARAQIVGDDAFDKVEALGLGAVGSSSFSLVCHGRWWAG